MRTIALARRLALVGWVMMGLMTSVSAEVLVIPGSGNPEYVLGKLAEAFHGHQSQHQVRVPASTGTAGALRALDEGEASLTRVGRPLTAAELSKGYTYLPLGRDAVVFVAGQGVSVRAVTSAQMRDVYSGALTDWQALGGTPGPIRVVGRETTDASRTALGRYIKEFGTMAFDSQVKVVHLDPQALTLLDRYPTSLGFLNRSALFAAKSALVILALDGVAPTPESIQDGIYPVALEVGLAYKASALPEAGRAFLQFLTSPEAVSVLRDHALVPVVARP